MLSYLILFSKRKSNVDLQFDNIFMINSYRSSNLQSNYFTIIIIVAYTFFFHCPAHSFPVSLDFRRSIKVQGCDKRVHRTCSLCKASPHANVVSPLKSPHFFLYPLLQVFEVRTPFMMSYPLAGSSFRVTMPICDVSIVLLCHSLNCTTFVGK